MLDRRASERLPVTASGEIRMPLGNTIRCRVVDLSAAGARLSVMTVLGIPDQFDLRIPTVPDPLPARVVWKRAGEIGIAFE